MYSKKLHSLNLPSSSVILLTSCVMLVLFTDMRSAQALSITSSSAATATEQLSARNKRSLEHEKLASASEGLTSGSSRVSNGVGGSSSGTTHSVAKRDANSYYNDLLEDSGSDLFPERQYYGASKFEGKRAYVPRFIGKREDETTFPDEKRQAPRFVGKRQAPRFVGKRQAPRFVGKRQAPRFVGKRQAPRFVGKRQAPRFVGKRQAPRFVGKRQAPRYVGKRQAPRFVGKRQAPRFVGKRQAPRYVGKRQAPRFVGKRQAPRFVGKRYAPRFVGKRFGEDLNDSLFLIDGDRDESVLSKRENNRPVPYVSAHEFIQTFRKSDPYFMGKREDSDSLDTEGELSLQEDSLLRNLDELDKKAAAPRFVGKRYVPRFVGKRYVPRFVGKRYVPRFLGKRYVPRFVGKRYVPRFVGKRYVPRFVGKRYVPRFVGKRYVPRFVGKRGSPRFVGRSFSDKPFDNLKEQDNVEDETESEEQDLIGDDFLEDSLDSSNSLTKGLEGWADEAEDDEVSEKAVSELMKSLEKEENVLGEAGENEGSSLEGGDSTHPQGLR